MLNSQDQEKNISGRICWASSVRERALGWGAHHGLQPVGEEAEGRPRRRPKQAGLAWGWALERRWPMHWHWLGLAGPRELGPGRSTRSGAVRAPLHEAERAEAGGEAWRGHLRRGQVRGGRADPAGGGRRRGAELRHDRPAEGREREIYRAREREKREEEEGKRRRRSGDVSEASAPALPLGSRCFFP